MENLITDIISKKLNNNFFEQASQKTHTNPQQTKSVINAALPLLLSHMAKNSDSPEGARALNSALEKKHSGGVLDHLSDLVADPEKGEGAGILKHVLGSEQNSITEKLAQNSNLNAGSIGTILKIIAPILMGSLGKTKQSGNLNSDQLSPLLKIGANQLTKKADRNLLSGLLDKNNDGNIKDDLMRMGMGYIKNFFSKKA